MGLNFFHNYLCVNFELSSPLQEALCNSHIWPWKFSAMFISFTGYENMSSDHIQHTLNLQNSTANGAEMDNHYEVCSWCTSLSYHTIPPHQSGCNFILCWRWCMQPRRRVLWEKHPAFRSLKFTPITQTSRIDPFLSSAYKINQVFMPVNPENQCRSKFLWKKHTLSPGQVI